MILVIGGTGFIGRALVRQLVMAGREVRLLLRPSPQSPNLPHGVPVEAVICSLKDIRGLRAAMKGVDTVFHLAGAENHGIQADLMAVDITGTLAVSQACSEAGVRRLFYLSHLGADRFSSFPLLKAKGIAEGHIAQGKAPYTIIRSGIVFGREDHFSMPLAQLLRKAPGAVLLPGDGSVAVQPIWVEDLVTCMVLAMEDANLCQQTLSLGGGEHLSFRQVIEQTLDVLGIRRLLVPFPEPYLRPLTVYFESSFRQFPLNVFWLDYLAANRTCSLDVLPRQFGLIPARYSRRIGYLNLKP